MIGKTDPSMLEKNYREESAIMPMVLLLVLVVLISAPLLWQTRRISAAGAKAVNVEEFKTLISMANAKIVGVNILLKQKNVVALEMLDEVIVQEEIPSDEMVADAMQAPSVKPFKIDLKGVYWHPTRPLVDIGHNAQVHELLDKLDRTGAKGLGQIPHSDLLWKLDGLRILGFRLGSCGCSGARC